MKLLPVLPAHELAAREQENRWLIEGLWADKAVGIVGGEPKCCKSFLALDMAVSVASGSSCLGHFRVERTGRVLLYAAEDALPVVRERLEGIGRRRGSPDLAALDILVITAPVLRIDREDDQRRLLETIQALRPALLVLDPFVRLHRIDENVSSEVVPILAYLRELQRRFDLAIVVVHHAKKGAGKVRAGQALRGSSEFHAWGDSNLYLRRSGEALALTIEHRAAASRAGIPLALSDDNNDGIALELANAVVSTDHRPAPSARERLEAALTEIGGPVSLKRLRDHCRMRNATLSDALAELTKLGRVVRNSAGYELADH